MFAKISRQGKSLQSLRLFLFCPWWTGKMLKDVLWQLNSCAWRIIPRKTLATKVVYWRSRCRQDNVLQDEWRQLRVFCGLHSFGSSENVFPRSFSNLIVFATLVAFFILTTWKRYLIAKKSTIQKTSSTLRNHFLRLFTNNLLKIKFVCCESVNSAAFGQFFRQACTRFVPASPWCKQCDCDRNCCFVVLD